MLDSLTVARKELIELLGNRHSARGSLVQAAIVVAMLGVVVPYSEPRLWRIPFPVALLYMLFPGTLAVGVAADAFAGERERRTLETLLATPLSDRAIFTGKALTAVTFAGGVSAIAVTASALTIFGRTGAALLPSFQHVAFVLGGGLGMATLSTSLAIFVSMRVAVARSAQQMASLTTMLLTGATFAILSQLGIPMAWHVLPWLDAVLITCGVAALSAAMGIFRRDRIFDDR